MARPLRFRVSTERWHGARVEEALFRNLDANIGAEASTPWYRPPEGYEGRRFEMDNGDVALFCWDDGGDRDAYWIGNTETPPALWRTEKHAFGEVPYPVSRWAQRELLATLHESSPWLAEYPHLSWFFLPVFLSKDGREATRDFFREHAAGFPNADPTDALEFYEAFLRRGVLDDHRYAMAAKLGTPDSVDPDRMSATMGEFDAARLLADVGCTVEPDPPIGEGHLLDFRAETPGGGSLLVEVTRPVPPARRRTDSPARAVSEAAAAKADGQLGVRSDALLLVDCSSFPAEAWHRLREKGVSLAHQPTVIFRVRPDGDTEGFVVGAPPLDVEAAIA